MKAVVLEIKNGYAAVLREDGVVVKIKRRCQVGETIFLTGKEAEGIRQVSHARMIRNIAIAAAVVLVVLGGTSTYYLTATSAATVEVDTGDALVMLSLNHFNRVIGVSSGQEEDEELISAIDAEGIRNNTLDEALLKTAAVIRGRKGTDAEDNTEEAAEITIQTANDTTYEHLRGQAEKGGFSVKRKGDADERRGGHEEQEFSAAPETDQKEQMEHAQGTEETGMSAEDPNDWNEMAEERDGDFVSGQEQEGESPGQAQEGESRAQVQEGDSHGQMQESENYKQAQEGDSHGQVQEGDSHGQEAGNDTGQEMGPGESQGDRGEGHGARP